MYPALDIADIYVYKGISDSMPVTQMKLQKLLYFAHGALLAYSDGKERLLNEKFEAWKFGPVVPIIYQEFKLFGSSPISPEYDILRLVRPKNERRLEISNELHQEIINDTWEALKDVSATQLSNWTHSAGMAWDNAYIVGANNKLNEKDIIKDFKPLVKNVQE